MTTKSCDNCGAVGEGNFCASCGTPLGTRHCPDCSTAIAAANDFCTGCGRRLQHSNNNHFAHAIPKNISRNSRSRLLTIAALPLALLAVVVVLLIRASSDRAATAVRPAPAALADEFANLPPRERFLRLADRAQGAVQRGDTSTVVTMFPAVESAFLAMADNERDIDARFHLSLLRAEVGHFPGAAAQLDSIVAIAPNHLFADYLKALIADFQGDAEAARAARLDFRRHFAVEIVLPRPEYLAHRSLLDDFLKTTPTN